MKIRVCILWPAIGILHGVDLSHLHVGYVYDLEPNLANYLVLLGYGRRETSGSELEMQVEG